MLVFALIVRVALDGSRAVAAELNQLQMEAAAESVLHNELFTLLAPGQRTAGDGRLDPSVTRLSVRSGRSDGLIDLDQAGEPLLLRLFNRSYGSDARMAYDKLRSKQPVNSYAELAAALKLPESDLACLLQRATLFSGRRMPEPDAASEEVMALLGERSTAITPAASVTPSNSTYAQPWWIQIELDGPHGAKRRLRTEVIVTNRADRPFGVLDRRWLDPKVPLDSCA
jgi:hypothetical protein